MAYKPLLKRKHAETTGHKHCPVCQTCLMFPAQIHKCPVRVDHAVLEVMLMDMQPWNGRRADSSTPDYDGYGIEDF